MDELVLWLGEQLDEDERTARAATPGPWRYDPGKHHHIVGTPLFEEAVFAGPPGSDATCVAGTGETDDRQSMADAEFIARHDPARVLREINATRELLRQYEHLKHEVMPDDLTGVWAFEAVLRAHALVYAGRPGYREDWRP